ncbi:hypothetical protein BGZ65_012515, partial [Modicella reniformis]
MLNLAIKFSALFSTFIQEQKLQGQSSTSFGLGMDSTREQMSKSGRRVSFHGSRGSTIHRVGVHDQEEDLSTDSEEETIDQEQEEEDYDDLGRTGGSEKRKKGAVRSRTLFGYEGVIRDDGMEEDDDEDIEMDTGWSRAKRPKTGPGISGFSQVDLRQSLDSRRNGSQQRSSYRESLVGIEQEFNRCREFLVTSLRVVVNSNAARG